MSTEAPEQLAEHIAAIKLPEAGGLWLEHALAKAIRRASAALTVETIQDVPLFVVITSNERAALEMVNLDPWRGLIPDLTHWFLYRNGELTPVLLSPRDSTPLDRSDPPPAVIALQQGTRVQLLHARRNAIYDFEPGTPLRVFEPVRKQFVAITLPNRHTASAAWIERASLWHDWRKANANPADLESQRRTLIERSRVTGVLLPLASLIVVETASQWEILARKEQQALDNHGALDFEETQPTPEPPGWLLLAIILFFLYLRGRSIPAS